MKIFRLLLVFTGLFLAVLATGQNTLDFRFARPEIVTSENINYLSFDIQVKSDADNTNNYIWSGQAILNLDLAETGLSADQNNWSVQKSNLLTGTYNSGLSTFERYQVNLNLTTNTINISWLADFSNNNLQQTEYTRFNQITTEYQSLVKVYAVIDDASKVAGIEFLKTSMDGQQFYKLISDPWSASFASPNLYDPADLTTLYLGRIYAADVPGNWTQIGGSLNAGIAVNTSVWSGNAVANELTLVATNARIHNGATLLVGANGQANVDNFIIEDTGVLTINSTATNTGSIIAGSVSGTGSTVARRYMTTGAWHFVSSPLQGQLISDFLADNTPIIPTKDDKRGMMDYNPAGNVWNDFFTDGTGGNLEPGAGYAVRTSTDGVVEFSGTINTGNFTLNSLVANSWNLVGNPYTSGLGINNESTITNFLNANLSNLDDSYAAVYLWDQLDANNGQPGKYSFISNAGVDIIPGAEKLTQGYVQPGQGFLVKMNSATSLSYTPAMQAHVNNTEAPFKSAKSWPAIALDVKSGQHSSSAYIGFNNYMTPGLDPTYDIGAYRGDADLMLSSRLIEDNGVKFALQCLPANNSETWIIPLGIDSRSGGEITFSANTIGLHAFSTVILEDRLNNIFTPLKTPGSFYRANLEANSSSVGRFFLHTSYQTTSFDDELTAQELKAYMARNEIVIDGRVSSKAVATLYDVQGRSILVRNLKEGFRNTMSAQGLKTGFYLLQVIDNGQKSTIKIPVVAQ